MRVRLNTYRLRSDPYQWSIGRPVTTEPGARSQAVTVLPIAVHREQNSTFSTFGDWLDDAG